MALCNCELHARNDDDDTCCFTTWFCHFKTHLLKVPYDEVLVRLPAAVLETSLLLLIVAVSLLIMPLPQSGALYVKALSFYVVTLIMLIICSLVRRQHVLVGQWPECLSVQTCHCWWL